MPMPMENLRCALRRSFAVSLVCLWATAALADYDALPSRDTDLSGRWVLNAALSDDAEALLAERLEKERRRYSQERRRDDLMRPPGMPPQIDVEGQGTRSARPVRAARRRRDEAYRRLLDISDVLTIEQSGSQVQIVSTMSSRRLEAGSRSQVSMPQGDLADSEVGWNGEWFVIERRVRRGIRIVEKFRLLAKTGQLEYRLAIGGDSELSRLKVRRVYERASGMAAPRNPSVGPVR